MTAVTAPGASFTGADVDGLDRLAGEFSQAASVCDEVKAACEVIVAASFLFGPFGAGFVAYLKGTVIPWLTRISEALQLMAKVLSARSQAQRQASSPSSLTGLPAYATPALPAGTTTDAPAPAGGEGGNGPGEKPLSPGTLDHSRSTGAVMDREGLAQWAKGGETESPLHPTVPLQKWTGPGFALLDHKGEHVDLALDQAKLGEASWMGVDRAGREQVGGTVEGSFNAVDLKVHTSVPLGGSSTLGLSNETTVGAHASVSAQASYNPADGSASASLGGDVFVGAQNTTVAEVRTPYFTDRAEGTVQFGEGAAALVQVETTPGHLTVRLAAGLAEGLGGKVTNSLDVDYGRIATDIGAGVTSLEQSAAHALGLDARPAR